MGDTKQLDIATGELIDLELIRKLSACTCRSRPLANRSAAWKRRCTPSCSGVTGARLSSPRRHRAHAVARSLLQDWDDGVAVVGDAAAQDARVLRVGTLTSIGRALYRDHRPVLQAAAELAGRAAYLRMGRPDSGPAGPRGRHRVRVAAH